MHVYRYLGDFSHAISVLLFLVIVGIKGNGSGVSLKSHYLYLIVFLTRYLDVVTTFYNWYNTLMKIFFFASTISIIFIMTKKEPAKSTYSPTLDAVSHLNLVIAAALTGMVIHLVGSGVVDIKGSSGQEFEVHFEHYR
jgi:ER lumen protein retaining receptor